MWKTLETIYHLLFAKSKYEKVNEILLITFN